MDLILAMAKKYTDGLKIDLADYGVDVVTLMYAGGGTAQMTNSNKLWKKVNAHKGKIYFACENAQYGMRIETPATKINVPGRTDLSASIIISQTPNLIRLDFYVMNEKVVLTITTVG